MSFYKEHKMDAISDEEYQFLSARENARDEWEREHEFDDITDDWEENDDE